MDFLRFVSRQVTLFDGGMGTEIQKLDLRDGEWGGYRGCNEMLSITAPERIAAIHRAYLEAGADVIETNTFGAQRITLSEYGLADRTEEINRRAAELARREAEAYRHARPEQSASGFVAGAVGPGTKLPSLGHVDFPDLYDSIFAQAAGLCQGGVDLFIVETSQDPLQAKAALLAIRDAQEQQGRSVPVIVSVTVESGGSLLVGSSIEAVAAALEPLRPDIMGINCATGPEEMRPHIRRLAALFAGPVFCMPNAGFPEERDGELVYSLGPEEFADTLTSFVEEFGVDIIGGCCGTGPSFIRELRGRIPALAKAPRSPRMDPSLASLYSVQSLSQEPPPFFVGERTNTNGSRAFRERLLADDIEGMTAIARRQAREGAHALDLCVAYTGREEAQDMRALVPVLVRSVDLPLVIDSTEPAAVEAALQLNGGRPLINSVNLENGEEHAARIFDLAARYGAAIICLTIDEEGMAMTPQRKLAIAGRLLELARSRGLRTGDLVFDPLTFTLGSGEASLRGAGTATLEALKLLKREYPTAHTILGVSNISYGLAPRAREVLSSVFLHEAVEAGLDLAIVNVRKILPPARIPEEDYDAALRLLYDRGPGNPLLDFIDHFSGKEARGAAEQRGASASGEEKPPAERLRSAVIEGESAVLKKLLPKLLEERSAEEIIQGHLIPAMREVGRLFGEGSLQLPFVLQSAEVMKQAVDELTPYLSQDASARTRRVVLATVRGDVHDIGKNLVDIILTNNGYEVHNLGIKCGIETIIEKARETGADAIGMSGLLVKSTIVMRENLEAMRSRGLDIPVLLGGAALTEDYVQRTCAPLLDSPVFYCRDAFDGLTALDSLFAGEASEAAGAGPAPAEHGEAPPAAQKAQDAATASSGPAAASSGPAAASSGPAAASSGPAAASSEPATPSSGPAAAGRARSRLSPAVADWSLHQLGPIAPEQLFPFVRETRLFRGRWGYRGAAGEERLWREEILPNYHRLRSVLSERELLRPRAAWRFLPCNAEGDELIVYRPGSREPLHRLHFPRRRMEPRSSVADFFLPAESGRQDVAAFQIVTLGPEIKEFIDGLYRSDRYKEYLLYHGLAVELTEALADYLQHRLRRYLPADRTEAEAGTRFSFGYPCCPDLELNRTVGELLRAEALGVEFTEEGQMVPEFSTSGFVSFDPAAHYFSLK